MTPGDPPRGLHSSLFAISLLDILSWLLIVTAMAVMAVTVAGQVVLRYAFSIGIDWSEELARLAFVWAMFLALPHGVRNGVHVGIDVLVTRLPRLARHRLLRLTALFSAILMAVLLYYALGATAGSWSDRLPTMPLTQAGYYLPVAIAAGHGLLNCLLLVAFGEAALIHNTLAEPEPEDSPA
ncbi:MAG: TRAP transporter small permease subunit [Paracoccus sp. (in: a-proteobacteria)]|nr:TRAP transporter small permease subunit [Paracoccus sp. (in: a-proteobacteria)]